MKPDYRFYATLFDSFQWYKTSWKKTAKQEFIDKLNRVPFTAPAAEKGTAFNDVIDFCLIENPGEELKYKANEAVNKYGFEANLINEIAYEVCGSKPQHKTTGFIETSIGVVEVYGNIDYLLRNKAVDLKTCEKYFIGKFLNSWQKLVYPYALSQEGIIVTDFEFLVTDFKEIYHESYPVDLQLCKEELIRISEELISFIQEHRNLITDKKLFNQLQAA